MHGNTNVATTVSETSEGPKFEPGLIAEIVQCEVEVPNAMSAQFLKFCSGRKIRLVERVAADAWKIEPPIRLDGFSWVENGHLKIVTQASEVWFVGDCNLRLVPGATEPDRVEWES